jgi:hypothetical protein
MRALREDALLKVDLSYSAYHVGKLGGRDCGHPYRVIANLQQSLRSKRAVLVGKSAHRARCPSARGRGLCMLRLHQATRVLARKLLHEVYQSLHRRLALLASRVA